jgi:DNA uptake protein ComE-like DNA-binding protein
MNLSGGPGTCLIRVAIAAMVGSMFAGSSHGVASEQQPALQDQTEIIRQASDLDPDPLDAAAVAAVCTRCHVAAQFLSSPRSSSRWEQTFEKMVAHGATGSDEQINRLVSYFQKNLTIINVNTSPPEELGPTLQVDDVVVAKIVAQRRQKKFAGLAALEQVPGVDPAKLNKLYANGRLLF